MGDLTPQLKLPLYQSTASWWGKISPFSYPLTAAWTDGQSKKKKTNKKTKLGGFCLGLGRYLKVKREPAQLFFPGGRGSGTSRSPSQYLAVKYASLVAALPLRAGRGLQDGGEGSVTPTKAVWTPGSAAPFPHAQTTSVYGSHLPAPPTHSLTPQAIIANIY